MSANSSTAGDWTAIYRQTAWAAEGEDTAGLSGGGASGDDADESPWARLAAGYNDSSGRGAIGGCSHDHAQEQRVYDLPINTKLRACAVYRRMGNQYFKEGAYGRAVERYRRALIYYEYAFPEPSAGMDEQAVLQQEVALCRVRLAALLNTCACMLKLKQWEEAVSYAHQALAIIRELQTLLLTAATAASASTVHGGCEPTTGATSASTLTSTDAHIGDIAEEVASDMAGGEVDVTRADLHAYVAVAHAKALFRRAAAYRHLHSYELAASDLLAAQALLPGDAKICSDLSILRRLQHTAAARSAAMARHMFQQPRTRSQPTNGSTGECGATTTRHSTVAADADTGADMGTDTGEDDASSLASEGSGSVGLEESDSDLISCDGDSEGGGSYGLEGGGHAYSHATATLLQLPI